MFLVLALYRSEMLNSAHRAELLRNYCHPAYLVENGVKAFEGQEIHIPQVRFGPQITPLGDNSYESVNSESDSGPSYMLAPLKYTLENYKTNPKRGRQATKRKRSRGVISR